MSLNDEEKVCTRIELQNNLERTGLSLEAVASALDYTSDRLENTLHVTTQSHPADVWLLRDFLDQVIRDRSGMPAPWTVLTDGGRRAAAGWFRLCTPPPTPPT